MRIKMIISYDGTNYWGFAKQPGFVTIEGVIEDRLKKIFNKEIRVYGSGRTDKHVHALNQVCDFKIDEKVDLKKLFVSLNKLLPLDIRVKKISKVKDNFSSRLCAKKKTYSYTINIKEIDPFRRNFEVFIKNIDFTKIKNSMDLFLGVHNFQNFTSKDEDDDNFIREIYEIKLIKKGNRYIFKLTGNGFMKYMVRKIVGTLIALGQNKIDRSYITDNLNSSNRDIVPFTAKPEGLCLEKVYY